MTDFNPNTACAPNGNFFGFPFSAEESRLVLLSVPWDVTTSYRKGASKGPKAILDASIQLDFFDFEIPDAWNAGIGTCPLDESLPIAEISEEINLTSEDIGARRLHTIMENLLEDISFNAGNLTSTVELAVDRHYVETHLEGSIKAQNLKKYIL